jgi:3-hydroxyisobutyrate dehydrogenase-like beta-hydroxyacid dehydrogenase
MGIALCERLVASGFAVTGTDVRGEARAAALAAGAGWAESVTAAAPRARFLVTCLPGDEELDAVTGELTRVAAPDALWIEMSSVSPGLARTRDARAAARGVIALDAPVGGDPDAARAGRLLCFVGGSGEAVRSAQPILTALADRVVHVGPSGAGYLVKLLSNTLWFTQVVASAEALAVAARAGLDPELVRGALAQGAAGGRVLDVDAAALLRGERMANFSLARCCDQLAAVLHAGDQLAVPVRVATAVADVHREALAHYGEVDGELLGARWVADRAGVDFD